MWDFKITNWLTKIKEKFLIWLWCISMRESFYLLVYLYLKNPIQSEPITLRLSVISIINLINSISLKFLLSNINTNSNTEFAEIWFFFITKSCMTYNVHSKSQALWTISSITQGDREIRVSYKYCACMYNFVLSFINCLTPVWIVRRIWRVRRSLPIVFDV